MLYRDVLTYKMNVNEKKDITHDIKKIVEKSGISDGLCNIFLKATTAGLMINEDDRMLMADIERVMKTMAPDDKFYNHPENAHSHIRASMLNTALDIPVSNGQLLLGTWQSIILWEHDVRDRERTVVVTIMH